MSNILFSNTAFTFWIRRSQTDKLLDAGVLKLIYLLLLVIYFEAYTEHALAVIAQTWYLGTNNKLKSEKRSFSLLYIIKCSHTIYTYCVKHVKIARIFTEVHLHLFYAKFLLNTVFNQTS